MLKKRWFKNLPLILLISAIAFSPSFPVGEIAGGRTIEIRIEDILLVILGLAWLSNFLISGRRKVRKLPLFLPILAWLSIGFFSSSINLILGNVVLSRAFFYLMKEIEFFFLYFYVFYYLECSDSIKFIANFWVLVGVIDVLFIIYQLISGVHYGAYGAGLFREAGPFPSGGFFLILFTNLFNIFIYHYSGLNISKIEKEILFLCVLSTAIGVISSGSRTSVLGLALAIVLSLLLYKSRRGSLKPFIIGFIVFLFISGAFYTISKKVPYLLGLNPEKASSDLGIRVWVWKSQLGELPDNPFYFLFGLGKSVLLWTEESHNQYIRNLIETGIIGSLIFSILIFAMMKRVWQGFSRGENSFEVGLSAGLLVATLVMLFVSILNDAFVVVKVMEVYWFFAALTMAALSFNKLKSLKEVLC